VSDATGGVTGGADMRFDLQILASWITPGSRVLDLGCGRGDLLSWLAREKNIQGRGIERDEDKVAHCIRQGLSVIQGDINVELRDYPNDFFDYVVLSQTLQQVFDPPLLIREMLRTGARGIVSFPNFSHWRIRLQVLLTGKAPVTRELPYPWFTTPNIRVITLMDFRSFCRAQGITILKQAAINTDYHATRGHVLHLLPTLRATYGIFLLTRRP